MIAWDGSSGHTPDRPAFAVILTAATILGALVGAYAAHLAGVL